MAPKRMQKTPLARHVSDKPSSCLVCYEDCTSEENCFACYFCEHWVHSKCVDINPNLFKILEKNENFNYICVNCKNCNKKSNNNDCSKILEKIDNLEEKINAKTNNIIENKFVEIEKN